jgi:cold shock protein
VSVLEPTPSVAKALRKKPEEMVNIVEDLIKLLENLERTYRRGRHSDPRSAKQTADLLRALAAELELS